MVTDLAHAPSETRAPVGVFSVAPDVWGMRLFLVNVFFIRGDGGWALIDCGVPGSALAIARAGQDLFGAPADAIVLTHGHFDHIGAVRELARRWDCPVYAHHLEAPYLSGRSSYPPPDPTVGGGLMTLMSPLFPRRPIDLGRRLRELPASGTVPGLPDWTWIHTPGHTPGHISLFRRTDATLIAGDAFITTRQESAFSVATQLKTVHGPPMYFTQDWDAARDSVRKLAALEPETAGTGHGMPMAGARLRQGLEHLADNFDTIARPRRGRYVQEPALADERGTLYIPPPPPSVTPRLLAASAVGAAILALAAASRSRPRGPEQGRLEHGSRHSGGPDAPRAFR